MWDLVLEEEATCFSFWTNEMAIIPISELVYCAAVDHTF